MGVCGSVSVWSVVVCRCRTGDGLWKHVAYSGRRDVGQHGVHSLPFQLRSERHSLPDQLHQQRRRFVLLYPFVSVTLTSFRFTVAEFEKSIWPTDVGIDTAVLFRIVYYTTRAPPGGRTGRMCVQKKFLTKDYLWSQLAQPLF